MEERSQILNGEGSHSSDGKRCYDDSNDDDERSFDSGSEHRSCGGHNLMNHVLNGETKETLTVKEDRMSDMTDEILLHILSFLPTKDAIKASTLSQRWLYLWTFVPSLDFTSTTSQVITRDYVDEYITIVDQTLLSYRCGRVNLFSVYFHGEKYYGSKIDAWVRFATSANVENLCLNLMDPYAYRYILPQHVYTDSSIRTLRLMWCRVAPDGLISWKSLKSLLIGYTNMSEHVIQNILVGAPLLESLELFGCGGFKRLHGGSASLRKLVVADYSRYISRDEEEYGGLMLEISAPNLQSFSISGILGRWHRMKLRLMNIQSLDACNLKFESRTYCEDRDNGFEEHRKMVGELLDRLRHVKTVTMGNWCIKIVSLMELKSMSSPLFEFKCLVLDTYIRDIPGIVGLLQSSPDLETLVINMSSLDYSKDDFDERSPENYWTLQKESSKCLYLNIKTVKIFHSGACCCDFKIAIPLIQFLLEKARTLEKMLFNAGRGCSQNKLLQVSQELLSLPRLSPHAVIIVSE